MNDTVYNTVHKVHKVHKKYKKCNVVGCTRKCKVVGCTRMVKLSLNYCKSHYPSKYCRKDGCEKRRLCPGFFCGKHGGGIRCKVNGCNTIARSRITCLCIYHTTHINNITHSEINGNTIMQEEKREQLNDDFPDNLSDYLDSIGYIPPSTSIFEEYQKDVLKYTVEDI